MSIDFDRIQVAEKMRKKKQHSAVNMAKKWKMVQCKNPYFEMEKESNVVSILSKRFKLKPII